MGFLDDLSKRLTVVGQEAASQTKIFAETTKINAKISDEEKQINNLYLQLGKICFENNRDNPDSRYSDIVNNIKDAQTRIVFHRDELRRARGLKSCPQCGEDVPINSQFCNFCGSKVPEVEPQSPEIITNKCPHCGAPVDDKSAFCLVCGGNLRPIVTSYPANQTGSLGSSLLNNEGSYSYSTPVQEKSPLNFEIPSSGEQQVKTPLETPNSSFDENGGSQAISLEKDDNF